MGLSPGDMWWLLLTVIPAAWCGLLGAGVGEGSCAAAPYRTPSNKLKWPHGCPGSHPCCSEYGYCQTRADWWAQKFRDCNGESNGIALPQETIIAEAQFAQSGGGGGGWSSGGDGFSGGTNNIGCGNGGCSSGYPNGGSSGYSNGGSNGYSTGASSGCGGAGCGGGCRGGCGGGLTGPLGRLVSGSSQGLAFPPNRGYTRNGGRNRRCKRCGKKK